MYSSQANARRQNLYRASILIIEDNPDDRTIIGQACKRALAGIETVWASNLAEALQYLDECDGQEKLLPKLVLLDLYLPSAEQGWSFLQHLKERSLQRALPVVVLSQSTRPDDISRSYDLGANSYITKPLSIDAWLAYFESLRLYWWETVTLPTVNA